MKQKQKVKFQKRKNKKRIGNKKGLDVDVKQIENPRLEMESHYYNADHEKLKELGFKPSRHIDDEISLMLDDLLIHKERIEDKKKSIVKKIKWQVTETSHQ